MSMLKIITKDNVKLACSLIVGVFLCAYIMIPLFSALFLSSLSLIHLKYVMFAFSALEAAACGLSGFIMAVIISFFSKNRELLTTLVGCLMVVIFYAFYYVCFIPYNIITKIWIYTLIDMVVFAVSLFGFAVLGAWLIARKRRLKIQKEV